MENPENLEIKAQKNKEIADNEKAMFRDSKITIKQAIKSAEARENLAKNELKLAKLRQNLAEKSKKLIERKEQVKEILNLSNNNLKGEEDYAIYNIKVAVIKKAIAEVQSKTAKIEKQIAEEELKIINEKLNVAQNRGILSKALSDYAKLLKISATKEKLMKAENLCIKQEKILNNAIKDVFEKTNEIRMIEDKLADLKKELSDKLAEREKIRLPTTRFPTNM